MAKALSELPIGALVKDEGTTFLNAPIIWQVADHNHAGYPENSTTLVSQKILTLHCYDAREPLNTNANIAAHGNSDYVLSNINQWLNSDAPSGEWYNPTHEFDAPPTAANLSAGFPYDADSGFLNGFSEQFLNCVLDTSITASSCVAKTPSYSDHIYTYTHSNTIAKAFLLSLVEVGGDLGQYADSDSKDSLLPLFTVSAISKADPSKVRYLTPECLEYADGMQIVNAPALSAERGFNYWLRDAHDSNAPPSSVRCVYWTGTCSSAMTPNIGSCGVLPALNIANTILVSDKPDTDGAYIIEWEEPPAAPLNITIPEKILGGEGIAISWNASPDDDIVGYILERQYNDGDWEELYDGAAFSHTDTIAFGWNSIAYRVCAYRGSGAKSSYLTSETRTVRNNTAPVINVITEPSSTPTAAFDIAYMVTDEDAEITVTESIDGSEKHKFTAADGQSNTFSITQEDWIKLANGVHTLKITAEDTDGAVAEYAYTFTKNETQIEFMLATAQAVKEMPIGLRLVIQRKIPTGAVFQVEVCNNGFDDAPTWEDATNAAMRGEQYLFVNSHKSAENWALNVKLTIDRNGATGDCYISSIRGYYETEV